jgi:flotillin
MGDFVDFGGGTALLAFAVALVVVLLLAFAGSRYRVANANEALIVAGRRGAAVRDAAGNKLGRGDQGIKVVVGGGTVVYPLFNRVGRLQLTARQIKIVLQDAITCQGIKVHVEGVATFKIGREIEAIRNAAERFLGTDPSYIDDIVKNVLEGSLRSIVGTLTIEELIMDREKLLQRVQDNAKLDLATTGIEIDSFTIQSIEDESGYITQLGLQKLAPVTRDAKIAQAVADQESAVKQAEAEQIKINAARDVALRQAEAEQVTSAAKARAEQAGPLAQAQAQQEVVRKQTELAIIEAERREKELLAATIKPADADAQAAISRAQGDKSARIAAAEAEARRVQLAGEAEATVVLTKGKAFAEALALKAEAYQRFNQAAVLTAILEAMPAIVSAAAEPIGNIDQLTVLSTDGASNVVKTTTETVAQANATIKNLTGVDLAALIAGVVPTAAVKTDGKEGGGKGGLHLTHHLDEAPDGNLIADVTADKTLDVTSTRGRSRAGVVAPAEPEAPARPAAKPAPEAPAAPAPEAAQPAPASAEPAAPETPAPAAPPAPPAQPAPAPAPAPAAVAVPPAVAAAEAAARQAGQRGARAVDTALHNFAYNVRRIPGADTSIVRGLTLDSISARAPGAVREAWDRVASQIPDAYRGLTLGQVLDRYPD